MKGTRDDRDTDITGTARRLRDQIWWGVLAPAASGGHRRELHSEIAGILGQPDSAQRLTTEGAEPSPLASAAFAQLLVSEIEKWERVAREAGIKAE